MIKMHQIDEQEKKTLERRVKKTVCPLIQIDPPKGSSSWTVPDPSRYYCAVDDELLGHAGEMYTCGSICSMDYAKTCPKYLRENG